MYFGFALDALVIDLDLLDTDILNKHFACLQDVLKKSLRHAFKTSSRDILMTRSLQQNNFLSSKTSSRRKIFTLNACWRRLQDMSWGPKNVCLETSRRRNPDRWIVNATHRGTKREIHTIIIVVANYWWTAIIMIINIYRENEVSKEHKITG